jgi:hypothetical protein
MPIDLDTRIAERIALCKVESRAYEIWLKRLTPANVVLAGLGGLLSLIAGLSIITEANLIEPKVAGWIAVLGAALTGLHNRLRCDPHQIECRKLANQFAALQTEYERLQLEAHEQPKSEQLLSLEHKLAEIVAERSAQPSEKAITSARQELQTTALR